METFSYPGLGLFCLTVVALSAMVWILLWVRELQERRFKDGLFVDLSLISARDLEKLRVYFWRFTARIPVHSVSGQTKWVEVPSLAALGTDPDTFTLINESREKIESTIRRLGYGRRWTQSTFDKVVHEVELTINKELTRIAAETKAQPKTATQAKKTVKASRRKQKRGEEKTSRQ